MGNFYMESTQINYRRDEKLKTVDQKLQELSETSAIDTDIAPVFKSTNTYQPGDMVYYRNKLYVFNVEHTGAWAAADVTATDVTTAMNAALSGKADYADLAGAFSAELSYSAGDLVIYNGIIYRCTNDHTGAWDADDFSATTIAAEIDSLKSGLTNVQGDVKLNTNDLTTPSRTKNLLPMTLNGIKSANTTGTWNNNEYTIGGCVFTVNTNAQGIVTSIDVSNANTTTYVSALYIPLPKNNNKYKFGGGGGNNYNIILWDNTTNARAKKWDGSTDSEASTNTTALWEVLNVASDSIELRCRVNANTPAGSSTYYPLLVGENETDPTFAPYIPSVESRIEAVESTTALKTVNVLPVAGHGITVDDGGVYRVGDLVIVQIKFTTTDATTDFFYGLPHPKQTGSTTLINLLSGDGTLFNVNTSGFLRSASRQAGTYSCTGIYVTDVS